MQTIKEQNDLFRRFTPFCKLSGLKGECVITSGIAALEPEAVAQIIEKVQTFDSFTQDNDPYGKHDFGAFDHPAAGKVFWKIDYYSPSLQQSSKNPADPRRTYRVLTVMLAQEY